MKKSDCKECEGFGIVWAHSSGYGDDFENCQVCNPSDPVEQTRLHEEMYARAKGDSDE